MIANEERLDSLLTVLRDDGLDDAELEQRVTEFQGALRRLREDPAEAARIDELTRDAEADQQEEGPSFVTFYYVCDGDMTVNVTNPEADHGHTAALKQLAQALAGEQSRLKADRQALDRLLEESPDWARPPRRRPWAAFSGLFVGVLAAATLATTFHASQAAVSLIAIILAGTTAVSALIALAMTWTSVRSLNRHGSAQRALELMIQGDSAPADRTYWVKSARDSMMTRIREAREAADRAGARDDFGDETMDPDPDLDYNGTYRAGRHVHHRGPCPHVTRDPFACPEEEPRLS